MSVFPPATADLVDRLTRYRDRLIAGDRVRSAALVDAAIADLWAEALANEQHEGRVAGANCRRARRRSGLVPSEGSA